MRYDYAPDLKDKLVSIAGILKMDHLDLNRIECIRSFGSSSRNVIARCHALGKLMQKAMRAQPFYAIEFLERFDKLPKEEQEKVIIHELLHIPKSFGGGFRQHNFVCSRRVEELYLKYKFLKESNSYIKEL